VTAVNVTQLVDQSRVLIFDRELAVEFYDVFSGQPLASDEGLYETGGAFG
jgi:hypothetical protein